MTTAMDLHHNPVLSEQVSAWLRAHKINPNVVTADRVTLDGHTIRYTVVALENPDDETNMDPDHIPQSIFDEATNSILTELRATPLVVEPNADVAAWLASDQR